ncbi:hypothetical protein NDU88_012955 [Pleurodeles waltl]|uniref:Uncharacterized protein n=1 Tax=Pleurodeles waltl TaxID=8319 RepID=A0AAV7R496_PLEWA|nr:hypothetical protein NDU88_012955 [Pleurodeles waltl]
MVERGALSTILFSSALNMHVRNNEHVWLRQRKTDSGSERMRSGEPPIKWSKWKRVFEKYAKVCDHGWVNQFLDNTVRGKKDGYEKGRELSKVKKSKIQFDRNHAIKVTKVKVGDLVMIKHPGLSLAGSKLSKPLRVIKIFTNAVKTCDHRVWNLNRVVLYKGRAIQEHQNDNEKSSDNVRDNVVTGNLAKDGDNYRHREGMSKTLLRKSTRKTQSPAYLQDYV